MIIWTKINAPNRGETYLDLHFGKEKVAQFT